MAEKSIKTIKFNDQGDDFPIWKFQMEAFLEELGCAEALTQSKAAVDIDDDDRKMNRKAYLKLALACDKAVSHQIIKQAVSVVFPGGDAKLAWEALIDRWDPKEEVDKQRAIHLAHNATSGNRTKHIDTRLHFVRELVDADRKILDIEYVRSELNQSDTFTKNTGNETFWRHTSELVTES